MTKTIHIHCKKYATSAPELERPVIRAFSLADGAHLVMIGNDQEDHELWRLDGQSAALVGTLHDAIYRTIRRTRQLNLTCSPEHFEWHEPEFSSRSLSGRVCDFQPTGKYQAA